MASDTRATTTSVNDGSQKGNASPATHATLHDHPDGDKDCRQALNDGLGKDDTSPVTNSSVKDHPDGAEIRRQVRLHFLNCSEIYGSLTLVPVRVLLLR